MLSILFLFCTSFHHWSFLSYLFALPRCTFLVFLILTTQVYSRPIRSFLLCYYITGYSKTKICKYTHHFISRHVSKLEEFFFQFLPTTWFLFYKRVVFSFTAPAVWRGTLTPNTIHLIAKISSQNKLSFLELCRALSRRVPWHIRLRVQSHV